MELRQLRYFIAVADEGNLTRAAARLNISQPPLGRQIAQLEDELGVKLMDRHARPIALTSAGRTFYEHAREILERVSIMEAAVKAAGAERTRLSIGYTGSSLYGALPEALRRFRTLSGVVDLSLRQLTTYDQTSALLSGAIDLGFGRYLQEDSGVEHLVLREEALVLAVPCGHRLSVIHDPVSASATEGEALILFPDPPHPNFSDLILAFLARHRVQPGPVEYAPELQSALGLVSAQAGLTLVPEGARQARTNDVRYLALSEEDAVCPVVMSFRAGERTPTIQLVLTIIGQVHSQRGWPPPPPLPC